MIGTVELESLVGAHLLTGVDRSSLRVREWTNRFAQANVINFTLDGSTYTAIEDPDDGYRSCMAGLVRHRTPTKNVFLPVKVVGRMNGSVLELVDVVTGKIVLEVGTNRDDSYYPSFVARFSPENMAPNADKITEVVEHCDHCAHVHALRAAKQGRTIFAEEYVKELRAGLDNLRAQAADIELRIEHVEQEIARRTPPPDESKMTELERAMHQDTQRLRASTEQALAKSSPFVSVLEGTRFPK